MTDVSRSIIRLVNKIFATTEQFSTVSNQQSTILKKQPSPNKLMRVIHSAHCYLLH